MTCSGWVLAGGASRRVGRANAEWNILVACDMPHVTGAFLKELIEAAEASNSDCLVPETGGKLDPLCDVYPRRVAPAAKSAIHRKLFKMQDFISTLRPSHWPVPHARPLDNVNTPSEWTAK